MHVSVKTSYLRYFFMGFNAMCLVITEADSSMS